MPGAGGAFKNAAAGAGLGSDLPFDRRAIKLLARALIVAPLLGAALAAFSNSSQGDVMALSGLAALATLVPVLGGVALHRRQLWPLLSRRGR